MKTMLMILDSARCFDAAFDLLTTLAAFNQSVALLFRGDAVLQLKKSETSYSKKLASLPMYDIEHVYVMAEDLQRHDLRAVDLCVVVAVVSVTKVSELMHQSDWVLRV